MNNENMKQSVLSELVFWHLIGYRLNYFDYITN